MPKVDFTNVAELAYFIATGLDEIPINYDDPQEADFIAGDHIYSIKRSTSHPLRKIPTSFIVNWIHHRDIQYTLLGIFLEDKHEPSRFDNVIKRIKQDYNKTKKRKGFSA